jgi:hypothetical protein
MFRAYLAYCFAMHGTMNLKCPITICRGLQSRTEERLTTCVGNKAVIFFHTLSSLEWTRRLVTTIKIPSIFFTMME